MKRSYWSCELCIEMPCCNTALNFPAAADVLSEVSFAGGVCWAGAWLWLPWPRCHGPLGSGHGVLHRGQAAGESTGCVGWGVPAGLGWGSRVGQLQGCQGVWTVWRCSSGMAGHCFISRIPALWRKGAYVLHGVGWWTLYLNQDAFAELYAESFLSVCYVQSPYLALGAACFPGWHRSSPIYPVLCFTGLRLSHFSSLQLLHCQLTG